MATSTVERIIKKAKKARLGGVQVALSAEEVAEAGIQPGEDVLLEIRRYTAEDWFAEGEGRVFTGEEFIAHLERCPTYGPDS
jgi:hypothetical protein